MPDPEIQPTADPTPPAPLDDSLDVGELLDLAVTKPAPKTISMVAPSADDATDDEEDGDEEDKEAAGSDADGDEEGAGIEGAAGAAGTPAAKAAAPTAEDLRAAGDMIAAAPQRINELPRGQRAGAVQEAMKLAYARGATDTFTAMQSTSSQEEQLWGFVSEQDRLRQDDPEAFQLWEDENLEDAARYRAGRAFFAAKAAGKPVALPGAPKGAESAATALPPEQQTIQDLANDELPRLPALTAEQRTVIREQEFPLTTAGLRAFRKAISDAEAEQARAKPRDPAAVRRQESAERRQGLARPQTGRGQATPPNKNPIADVNDPDALFEMGLERSAAARAG